MKRLAVVVAVAALMLGSFALAAPKARAQGAAPTWTIGDYWSYAGGGTIPQVGPVTVEMNYTVVAREPVTMGSVSLDTYHLRLGGNLTAAGIRVAMFEDQWVRAADLALVKFATSSVGITMTVTYEPPAEQLRFPLADGKEWTSATTVNLSSPPYVSQRIPMTANFSVAGPTSVTVPAGTFRAFAVTGTTGGNATTSYYSDEVGYLVRFESPSTMSPLSGLPGLDLVAYQYAGAGDVWPWVLLIVVVAIAVVAVIVAALGSRALAAPPPPQMPPNLQPPIAQPPSANPPAQPPPT